MLRDRGYAVTPVTNGEDGIALLTRGDTQYSAVLLDQVMPGKDGIATLDAIRTINTQIPVILVTQSSDEQFVEVALDQTPVSYTHSPSPRDRQKSRMPSSA